MASPVRKPSESRQRPKQPKSLEIVPQLVLDAPAVSKSWLKVSKDTWSEFWSSDVSAVVDRNSDMMALRRLWDLYDERTRSVRVFVKERLSTGSKGQTVLHPLSAHIARLDGEIMSLEDRFGLTPRARLNLGLAVSAVHQSLDRMNARFGEDDIIEIVDAD